MLHPTIIEMAAEFGTIAPNNISIAMREIVFKLSSIL
jgi:hypothetical protein